MCLMFLRQWSEERLSRWVVFAAAAAAAVVVVVAAVAVFFLLLLGCCAFAFFSPVEDCLVLCPWLCDCLIV